MWLTDSSIGRKVVMSVTGACLVLFLTFHMSMNLAYVYDVIAGTNGHNYNAVCEFLGTNWYALAGTAGLAALAVFHIIYAFWLTAQNYKARGNDRYAVSGKQPVHWAAKNMLVLGIIILLGLALHFAHFWYNMMFAELVEAEGKFAAADGYNWITFQFSCPVNIVLYIVWFAALWYHLTHGIWSSMQTLGLNGKVWLNRWVCISYVWATIIVLGFIAVIIAAQFAGCCGGSACCGAC